MTTTILPNPILTNSSATSHAQLSNVSPNQNRLSQLSPPVSCPPSVQSNSPLTPITTPRTLSIRFAPLPDPRASRAILPGRPGDSDVWWTREEKPDGTWGDYRLVLRRPNGQIIAVDDLAAGSDERIKALETYRSQQTQFKSSSAHFSNIFKSSPFDYDSPQFLNPLNSRSSPGQPDQILSQSDGRLSQLLPPIATQTSNPSAGSGSNPIVHTPITTRSNNPLTLTRTISRESTCSNHSFSSQGKGNTASNLTKKFFESMKKPLSRDPHRLTPTNSLPIDYEQYHSFSGAPLCKSRSIDSSTGNSRKRFGWGIVKIPNSGILRKTRSRDEPFDSSYANPPLFDEPPIRRRSNYPPVAQRKVHMGGGRGGAGKVALSDEPDFVEWKSAASATSPGTVNSSNRIADEAEGDDGSGMAWLRKRKKEREERLRREEERARCFGSPPLQSSLPAISELPMISNDLPQVQTNDTTSHDLTTSNIGDIRLSQILPTREEAPDEEDLDSTTSSVSRSSILSRDGAQRSGGTRTSTSSTSASSKESIEDDEDLNEEELKEEERLKALALAESPFVKGAAEVYRDREHHQMLRKV